MTQERVLTLRIFADDEKLPPGQRRVTSHPKEVGQTKAEVLSKDRPDLLEFAKNMISAGDIPEGAKQHLVNYFKSENFFEIQKEVTDLHAIQVFRMAINHFEAIDLSRSDIGVDLDPLQSQRYTAFAEPPLTKLPEGKDFSLEKLRDALDIALSLSGHETAKQIVELRQSRLEREFFWELVSSEISAIQQLNLQMSHGREALDVSLIEEVYGTHLENQIMGGAGLALASGSLIHVMSRREFGKGFGRLMAAAGFALALGPAARPALERRSLIGESDYSGPRWPSIFTLGESNPSTAEIAATQDRIIQLVAGK